MQHSTAIHLSELLCSFRAVGHKDRRRGVGGGVTMGEFVTDHSVNGSKS